MHVSHWDTLNSYKLPKNSNKFWKETYTQVTNKQHHLVSINNTKTKLYSVKWGTQNKSNYNRNRCQLDDTLNKHRQFHLKYTEKCSLSLDRFFLPRLFLATLTFEDAWTERGTRLHCNNGRCKKNIPWHRQLLPPWSGGVTSDAYVVAIHITQRVRPLMKYTTINVSWPYFNRDALSMTSECNSSLYLTRFWNSSMGPINFRSPAGRK